MSFLKRLFGGGGGGESEAKAEASEPLEYKGYVVRATPFKDGGQFQCCGVITREVDGAVKEHRFIRADKFTTLEDAFAITLRKGQQIIDEQGDRMFG
ncbi:MAG: hypothetical protein J0H53_11055 [Rhizobiales bacterium]|jgi:hypothetical protein|nr:hypothetical protein [Hyphomicrobiales bacterium]OJU35052.1 MAG: hypothetical protein BGN94_03175 [Rhizobiales bacterium 68-8]